MSSNGWPNKTTSRENEYTNEQEINHTMFPRDIKGAIKKYCESKRNSIIQLLTKKQKSLPNSACLNISNPIWKLNTKLGSNPHLSLNISTLRPGAPETISIPRFSLDVLSDYLSLSFLEGMGCIDSFGYHAAVIYLCYEIVSFWNMFWKALWTYRASITSAALAASAGTSWSTSTARHCVYGLKVCGVKKVGK